MRTYGIPRNERTEISSISTQLHFCSVTAAMSRASAASSILGLLNPNAVVVIVVAMKKNVHPALASFSSSVLSAVGTSGERRRSAESPSTCHSGGRSVPGATSRAPAPSDGHLVMRVIVAHERKFLGLNEGRH